MSGVIQSRVPEAYSRNPQRFNVGESDLSTMAGGVIVSGVQREMGGLSESLATFRKHHREVGDALMNISGVGTKTGGPVDKDEERPRYDPNAPENKWPRMLYHQDGREAVVFDADEMKAHLKQGYRTEQYQKPRVAVEDPRIEKARLEQELKDSRGQVAALNDLLVQMKQQFETLQAQVADLAEAKASK